MTLNALYQRFVNTVVRLIDPQRLREALDTRLSDAVVSQLSDPDLQRRMQQIESYLASVHDVFDMHDDLDTADTLLDELDDAEDIADNSILEADCAIYALLEEKNWREWKEDERRGIHQAPREKTIYDLYDAYLSGQSPSASPQRPSPGVPPGSATPSPALARRDSHTALGMYKFTDDGECITVLGGKWHAVAYELETMLQRTDPCPWDR